MIRRSLDPTSGSAVTGKGEGRHDLVINFRREIPFKRPSADNSSSQNSLTHRIAKITAETLVSYRGSGSPTRKSQPVVPSALQHHHRGSAYEQAPTSSPSEATAAQPGSRGSSARSPQSPFLHIKNRADRLFLIFLISFSID